MSWLLSRFRAGDLVEVRSKEEILATLDQRGCIDGMPFMPEMLQYCGQRFSVRAVAHKTCDTICNSGGRRLHSTVHLADLRCDGSAHGGCQAECSLFWKDAWLKPVNGKDKSSAQSTAAAKAPSAGYTEADLVAQTRLPESEIGEEPRYVCQSTSLLQASERLPWWDLRQYLNDMVTRNHSVDQVLRVLWLASLQRLLVRTPFGYRLLASFYNTMHRWLTNRGNPYVTGKIKLGTGTPAGRLDLGPGELVRVKPKNTIEATVDESGRNRGLTFDKEMAPYCDSVVKVHKSVEKIIDESSGKMRHMKQRCIMLEGVVCKAGYSGHRLMCPRAIPSYWREIWLERANGSHQ